MKSPRPVEIVRLLATNKVEFIVVGMTAGVLQAALPALRATLDEINRRS